MNNSNDNARQLTNTQVIMFGMGTACIAFMFSMVNSYFNFYVTDIALVPAEMLGTANFIIRLLLVVVVPVMAAMVQNGYSKHGKYRIWIYRCIPIVAITLVLTFTKIDGPVWLMAIYYPTVYAISSGLAGMCGNAQLSLMSVMGKSDVDKRRLSTGRSLTQDITKIIFNFSFIPLATMLSFSTLREDGSPGSSGYFWMAVIIAVLSVAGYMGTAWSGKKYDIYDDGTGEGKATKEAAKKEKMSTKQMADVIFKNRPLLVMLILETFKFTAFMMFISTFVYYFFYVLFDFTSITVVTTIASVASVVASLLAPGIIKFLGRKTTNVLALILYAFGALMPRFLVPMVPESGVMVFGIGFVMIYFGMSLQTCVSPIMFLESANYYMKKTGVVAHGFVMSLFVFPVQIGIALSGGISNWLLAAIGYDPTAAAQPAAIADVILVVPAVLWIIAAIITFFYPIRDKETAEEAAIRLGEVAS